MVKKSEERPSDPETEENKRLRSLAISRKILSHTPANPSTPPPSFGVVKLDCRDIVKRGQRKSRCLFSFSGLLAPLSGGRVGELANLGTKNPVLYLEFPHIEEFLVRADELDQESESNQLPRPGTVLCKHKDTEQPHFAHGLCRKCYNKFVKISGGLQGGAEPPAFQRAEKQRMEKAKASEKTGESSVDMQPCHEEIGCAHNSQDSNLSSAVRSDATGHESQTSKGPEETGHHADDTFAWDGIDNLYNTELGAEESLSDIDDVEVNGYLHSEEETHYKRIIWEEMNKEYLEEQAAKEAAAAAKEAYDANIDGDDAIGGTGSKKPRKERKQRNAEDARNPAQTPAEATSRVLKRKGLSSKVNYDALGALYTSDKDTKKQNCSDADIADDQHTTIKGNEKYVESEGTEAVDEATTYEDAEYAGEEYGEHLGDDYGYNEDYDFEY